MVTTGAVLHGDLHLLLDFDPAEHPVALQLGGSDPKDLAEAVRIASSRGYDEYNLNCGCPSERVQKGSFGACLMLEPKLVADCVRAMASETDRPVTVKHRIGVDREDSYGFVRDFVGTVHEAGCRVFIVHTRAAWLKGLSPKENREVPPLQREYALMLKRDFPDAVFVVNGKVGTVAEAKALIDSGLDGVMMGRAAYQTPWLLTEVDEAIYGEAPSTVTRLDAVRGMTAYLKANFAGSEPALRAVARHMNGLCQGLPGARVWRRTLADPKAIKEKGSALLLYAWEQAFGGRSEEEES
jgi:tRNA-dihydrouridine synthase A